jgi:hypothetical protein
MALTQANCFRGAEPNEYYLKLFSARLEQESEDFVFQALTNLGEQVREEGDPSLLTLGMILQEIKLLTPRTKTAYEEERDEILAEQKKAREVIQ